MPEQSQHIFGVVIEVILTALFPWRTAKQIRETAAATTVASDRLTAELHALEQAMTNKGNEAEQ